MKLSEFLSDVGRPVAYYPKIAIALGGVKQAIFLCQLLYWADKGSDPDGWIYKTQDEWRDETGLSPYEQKTARKALIEMGILEEWNQRLIHRMSYRVDREVLDAIWEISRIAGTSFPESQNLGFGKPRTLDSGIAEPPSRYKEQRLQAENTNRESPFNKRDSRLVAGATSSTTDSSNGFAENENVSSDSDWPFEE